MKRVAGFFAERKWLLLATLPFVAYWASVFSRYQTLPDALFGGDAWQQFGIVQHLHEGHAPWTDSMFAGEWAFRDWLMYVLVAGIARATFLDPLTVAIFWPLVPLVLGGFCLHAIGRRLFANEALAVGLAVAWMGLYAHVGFQSSTFAAMLTVPWFFLVLVSQDGSVKRRVLLGLAYGLASLSYLVAFFGLTLLLGLVVLHRVLGRPAPRRDRAGWRVERERDTTFLDRVRREARWFAPVALVALPVILVLWAPLLLVYHGDVKNPSHLYADAARGWGWERARGVFQDLFLDVSHPVAFALGILSAIGVYASVRQWESHGGKWVLLVLAVGLVGTFHYLVTMPLVGNHLVYFRFPKIFLGLAAILLAFQAVVMLARDKYRDELQVPHVGAALVFVAVGAMVLTPAARSMYDEQAAVDDERTRAMLETAAWIRKETPEDAVFLSLDEESFALNGLTGRHVVTVRRTHANTFVDMDRRMADAAVMIYGQDREKARELMDQYHVTHAYVGWFWKENEKVSPLATAREYAEYWRANGVPFEEAVMPYDPVGDVQVFPVIRVVADASAEPPFLQDFVLQRRAEVEGEPWMSVYARRPPA